MATLRMTKGSIPMSSRMSLTRVEALPARPKFRPVISNDRVKASASDVSA